ncbi:SAM-dependent methyltransferase [Terrabacter sp. NPDC080008]|uniref:SAM-dependent methyltransferase n=1 Tax=Terrabacter sp. NPDC080008 TaxID=3155176 RepID=UPI003450245F
MDPLPWREAWHEALYAAGRGFYVARGGPAAHFTTAAHGPTGAALARALLRLWLRDHDEPPAVVVDVGAGRGELATHLVHALAELRYAVASDREEPPRPGDPDPVEWALSDGFERREVPTRRGEVPTRRGEVATRVVAVDVVERPEGLDERVEWLRSPGGAALPPQLDHLRDALVVAHEWLDVVPCTVAQVDTDGTARTVLVDPETGTETLGAPLSGAEQAWAARHWTGSGPGDRIEVGLERDRAWADLVSRVDSGTLLAVDYGHTAAARPSGGTLTAYALGQQTAPVPDGSCDVTAHVAMDSLDADEVRPQRETLRALGVTGTTPAHALATREPLAYLAALERAGAAARLLDRTGFGGFWWAVKRVGGQP